MADHRSDALYCKDIGNTTSSNLPCCYLSNQTASLCQESFAKGTPTFSNGCETGDCIADCRNLTLLYSSLVEETAFHGNGAGPKRRYLTCANIPSIAGYYSAGMLDPEVEASLAPYFPRNASTTELKGIAGSITGCLTSTCRAARNRSVCVDVCAPVNLLTNSTHPSLKGVNDCLNTLCTGQYNSLPYADADVVGIGVFASYIMQCMLVVLLWFGLSGFDLHQRKASRRPKPPIQHTSEDDPTNSSNKPEAHRDPNSPTDGPHTKTFKDLLVDFHKAQCYFSGTLQIASLVYGISSTDMLITFMLIPLSTNGVLPIVFGLVLLFRARRASLDMTLLTLACWILSSVVYWILYSHVIPVNAAIRSHEEKTELHAYQQFMYKLSAIDACGGYSALAVCPENFKINRGPIWRASRRIRVLTPIIWTWSTVCLGVVLGLEGRRWWTEQPSNRNKKKEETLDMAINSEGGKLMGTDSDPQGTHAGNGDSARTHMHKTPDYPHSTRGVSILYWIVTLCFLAGIGMQLSLLAIATSLNMMNRRNWSFGQVVAVTIWGPPLLGYVYNGGKEGMEEWRRKRKMRRGGVGR
ncbi:hypothetical protein BCR34DRAFT_578638 [Clohesyomyces aquaticus]|uniref:Uncharacterized protein n=1 Tax=Clohesyomyces aquaticus TaxID=1231657 RepID=A0A1Y1YF05_9PLEO|nr:hypothetical protein BCR34DRAFT_578638 [Clohesyomyces aquaticus]